MQQVLQASRVDGNGSKTLVDDDSSLMACKRFNMLGQTEQSRHLDIVLIFDDVFKSDDECRMAFTPKESRRKHFEFLKNTSKKFFFKSFSFTKTLLRRQSLQACQVSPSV